MMLGQSNVFCNSVFTIFFPTEVSFLIFKLEVIKKMYISQISVQNIEISVQNIVLITIFLLISISDQI